MKLTNFLKMFISLFITITLDVVVSNVVVSPATFLYTLFSQQICNNLKKLLIFDISLPFIVELTYKPTYKKVNCKKDTYIGNILFVIQFIKTFIVK